MTHSLFIRQLPNFQITLFQIYTYKLKVKLLWERALVSCPTSGPSFHKTPILFRAIVGGKHASLQALPWRGWTSVPLGGSLSLFSPGAPLKAYKCFLRPLPPCRRSSRQFILHPCARNRVQHTKPVLSEQLRLEEMSETSWNVLDRVSRKAF